MNVLRLERLWHRVLILWQDWQCKHAWHDYRLSAGYKRIYHYHIRKTGGTSLNHMFLSLGGEDPRLVYDRVSNGPYFGTVSGDKVFVGWDQRLIVRGMYYYAFSHTPQHRLPELPLQTFTLTCLRDPVNRVLSLYKMLYDYKNNNISHPGMVTQSQWLGKSFSDFLDRVPKEELLNQIFMFSRNFSINEAFENIMGCSHVMLAERFDSGIEQLNKKLNLNLVPLHQRRARANPPITVVELERLREMLQPSYVLYNKVSRALETLSLHFSN